MLSLQTPLEKGSKKLVNAWAFYDWANSVYSLVISSAIFPIYFAALFNEVNTVRLFNQDIKNTALISFVMAATFILISFTSPLLSGIADYIGNKKRFMKLFVYIGSVSCIGLYWFELDTLFLGLFFYFLALFGLWSSLVFYNSYLPDIAFPSQQDRASAKGYSMGYIGSVLLLLLNLAMVMQPGWFGIHGVSEAEASMTAMRYSFITVGIWWALFSQYSFYYLPKGNSNQTKITKAVFWNGYKELLSVWTMMRNEMGLRRFLSAFFLYSTALQIIKRNL